MFHCHSLYVIFYITWYKFWWVWIVFTFSDKIIRENIRLFDISFIYNLVDWSPLCYINFCSSFISVNVFDILAPCLFVCFCISLFSNINWDSFVNTFIFWYCQMVRYLIHFSQFSFHFFIHLFSFIKNHRYLILLIENDRQNDLFYHFY